MATRAAGFAAEQFQASFGRIGQRLLLAADVESIRRTIAGDQRPLKTGDRLADILLGNLVGNTSSNSLR